ncbi:MAG: hypothetical protein GQ477_05955 [Nanohaloarchaea archaeon]|nr:hypothetical protein [Candidatus Nanohaloarchaea archaeon]
MELARQSNGDDAGLCEKTGDSFKDKCYIDAAVKSKDIKLCERVTSETLQQACKAIVLNDPRLCEEISEEDIRDERYRLCNGLIGDGNKTAKIAVKESEIIDSDDLVECEKIDDASARDKCYVLIAETGKDESLCEKIGDDGVKGICYGAI